MKKILNISFWTMFIAGAFVLLSFSNNTKDAMLCKNMEVLVDWESGNLFVTEEDVLSLIDRLGYKVEESTMESIDTKIIETKIKDLSSVEEVSVFKDINGSLKINIIQRKPIARIFNANGSTMYLDDKGTMMPLSSNYSARVVVVNGALNESETLSVSEIKANDTLVRKYKMDNIYDFITTYKKDPFFEAQIEQIYINNKGEYIVIPKVGDQKINFGKPVQMEQKLKNYKTWITEGINPENLNLYREINLKYNGQIVCTKK